MTSAPPKGYAIAVPPTSRNDIEADARKYVLRKEPLRWSCPGRFDALEAWDSIQDDFPGVKAGVKILDPGEEGRCDPNDRVYISPDTYARLLRGDGRARFTVIHEIYHVLKHRLFIRETISESRRFALHRRSSMPNYLNPEWQADQFAGRVLMPTAAILKIVRRVDMCARVSEIVSIFGVSPSAAAVRISVLKKDGHFF